MTHEEVCKEYESVKARVDNIIAHRKIRIALEGNNHKTSYMKSGHGSIRTFLVYFWITGLLILAVSPAIVGM